MAYIDNTIKVEAVLTKVGRLRMAQGNFNITQFALSDDEVNYTDWNPNHPNGTAFFGEAIESLPLLEAFIDESQMMKNKLITLPRGTSKLPIISVGSESIVLKQGSPMTLQPNTLNFNGSSNGYENNGYSVTINDARLLSVFKGSGITNVNNNNVIVSNGTSYSKTEIGLTFSLKATELDTLFTNNQTTLSTTITIVGRDSGTQLTVGLTITKK